MSGAAGEEHANLYMRGVNQGASGAELDAQDVLDLLGVFGADGVRWYLIGILEGIEDEAEMEIEEYETLEAAVAFVVHESLVTVLEESESRLRVRLEGAPKDLSTEIDLHIVDDEDEILEGGRIIAVEFEEPGDHNSEDRGGIQGDPETAPAIVTVEKWKYEIIEYTDPEDGPKE